MHMESVLCVDDSSTFRKIIAMAMRQLKFKEIYQAENGLAAIEFLERKKVDLIILDINMPVMTGLEFLENRYKDSSLLKIPVIVLTTEGDNLELTQKVTDLGANAYCSKPFKLMDMRKTIFQILSKE